MGRSTIEEKEGDIYDYGARWNDVDVRRTDELGEKPVPVQLYPLFFFLQLMCVSMESSGMMLTGGR
jgi:hypothetical protein